MQTLRKNVPQQTKETVKEIVPVLLLQRRCVSYIVSKYTFEDEDGVTYALGKSPSKVFKEVFGSYQSFHCTFPKGNPLGFRFTSLDDQPADRPVVESSDVNFLWIGQLCELQQDMLTFLRAFLDWRADIMAIANRALAIRKDISAEAFLSQQDFVDGQILQMNLWAEEYSKMSQAKLEPERPPEPLPPQQPTAQPQLERPSEEEEPMPNDDADDDVREVQPESNAVNYFPHLVLPHPIVDVLNSVEPSRFDSMVSHARLRWNKFIELLRTPSDSTQWGKAMLSTQLLQTAGPKDRISFVYDSKTMSDSLIPDRIVRPFKHPSSFQIREFQDITAGLFGDVEDDPESRMTTSPFMWKGSASMFQVFDGRRPAATSKIGSHLNKVLKHVANFRGSNVPLRLMYSNKEFRGSVPPEPLETATQIVSKNFQVKVRGRKFIDLPGTNQTRGLNSIPFQDEFSIQVRYWFKTAVLGGYGGADDGKDVEVDMDFLGDAGDGDIECLNEGFVDAATAEAAANDGARMDLPVRIFPWSFIERVPREFLNMYQPTGVLLFGGGSGSWIVACARHNVRCVAFCKNDDHKTFLNEVVTVRIVVEMIEGKNDGFLSRRFLRREVSLGGHSEASAASAGTATTVPDAGDAASAAGSTAASAAAAAAAGSTAAPSAAAAAASASVAPTEVDDSQSEDSSDS